MKGGREGGREKDVDNKMRRKRGKKSK